MSYALAWHAASERDLRDLSHWRTAERIASAMMRFAETGAQLAFRRRCIKQTTSAAMTPRVCWASSGDLVVMA